MDNVTMKFTVSEAYPQAFAHFLRISGIREGSEKHDRMKEQALAVFEEIHDKLRLRASVAVYNPEMLSGDTLTLSGVGFRCRAYEQLNAEEIHRCVLYVLTAGEPALESERLTDLLFADIWATSFIEAGRALLRERVEDMIRSTEGEGVLSDSFGPGYYGMPLEEVAAFFKLVETETIRVRLHESGVILPIKTCTGMFLLLKEGSRMPPLNCAGCIGNAGGCRFCAALAKREE